MVSASGMLVGSRMIMEPLDCGAANALVGDSPSVNGPGGPSEKSRRTSQELTSKRLDFPFFVRHDF